MKPQPFDPPVPSAQVWAIPREGISDLASMLYAYITWGCEPHPSQVSEAEMRGYESVADRWERGLEKLLGVLEDVGHVAFAPEPNGPPEAPKEQD